MFTHRYEHQEMEPTNCRHDESARRPSEDFVAKFKEQHFSPENRPGTTNEYLKKEQEELDNHNAGHLNHSMYPIFRDESDGVRYDLDPIPKAPESTFRFTPSLLDPNSSAFAAFAAQSPGYYTPTPGGSTLGFQPYEMAVNAQAFNTPDLLSHSNPNDMSAPSIFQPHLHNLDPTNYMHFRPHAYSQDNYPGMSIPGSVIGGAGSESSPSNYSPETASGAETTDPELHGKFMNPGITGNEDICGQHVPRLMDCSSPCRFRFSTTLHAATAMLRHSFDIPVTYLNKRQAYTISVFDSSPAVHNKEVKQYRTTLRIAFDEEDQRRTAPACWRLWKDGRGTLESGGNPDKLRAIDFGIVFIPFSNFSRTG
jgi:CP2 transcription factor